MLGRQGKYSDFELIIVIAVIALVVITPLGREATSGPILILHRLLLIFITLGSISAYKSKKDPYLSPVFIALCSLASILMFLSVLWNPGSTFDGFYRSYQLLFFGAAFLAMASANRERPLPLKFAILYAVIGIDVAYLAAALVAGRMPLQGPFVNPNYYASFLLVGFSAAIAVAFFERALVRRAICGTAALLLYYGMTQAWSRGATICAIAVTALAVVRFSRTRGISRMQIVALLSAMLIVGAFASPILVRKFLDRGAIDPYNYQRPKIWLAALKVIGNHPFLGVGPGEFYYVSKRYSPPVEGTVARYLKRPAIAHSEYLQHAAESGIPAAVLLFSLAGYLVAIAVRRARRCTPEQRVLQESAILAATGLGLHALVDNNWSVPVMAAGLVVFSLGDVLPLSDWRFHINWSSPRIRTAFALALILITVDAVLIPGLAVTSNEAGQAAYQNNDLNRAETMYRIAAALAPSDSIFLNNAGAVYFDKFAQSHDSRWLHYAETFLSDASAANPNSDQPKHLLERVLIQQLTGDATRDRAIHMRIIAVDRDILRIDPVNPFTRKNLAEALYNVGDHEGAELELNRALEFEPNYIPAYVRLSDWFNQSGDQARSDEYRQRGIAVAVKYQNEKTSEPYESLLLGRPER